MVAHETGNALFGGALRARSLFGCPVFPCKPRDKKPATVHGVKDASEDEAQISAWWSSNPDYNPALATGSVVVFDFDDHSEEGGANGLESLEAWTSEHGALPETVLVKTGRGKGVQAYFANPDGIDIRNTTNEFLGIDIRGYGGYVMLPPSIHPNGNPYRYVNDPSETPLAQLDSRVLEFVEYVRKTRKSKVQKASEGVLVGGRNDALFREASRLQGLGVDDQTIIARVDSFNQTKCNPPLPQAEVTASVCSALRYQKGRAGDLIRFFSDRNMSSKGINDKSLGQAFAAYCGGVLAYVPEVKSWFAYDGVCWIRSGAAQKAERLMKDFIDGLTAWCLTLEDEGQKDACLKVSSRYLQHKARENVLADARSELVQPLSGFDTNPHLLNCLNVTIDFSGAAPIVREHVPEDKITQVAPVTYDPEAECQLFVKTLAHALEGDLEHMAFIQKLYGKVVSGDTSDDRFYLFGEQPRTGKGTVTSPLVEMLGVEANGYSRNAQPETFAVNKNRNASSSSGDRARLRGARLVITSEPSKGMELDASIIKEMTGGDLITARFNYGEDLQFRMSGLIFMLANNFPTINDPSVFASSRAVVLPFTRVIPECERDKTLRQRLKEPGELSGLLNWCIEGFRLAKAEGYDLPEAVQAATLDYERRSDEVANYIHWCLEADPDGRLKAADIWENYQGWCSARSAQAISKTDFYNRLRQRSFWRERATVDGESVRRVIVGYRFRD